MLDNLLLETFINTFYGYGNPQGDYWFIGMEESAEGSEEDINNRLNTWLNRGQHELEDVAEYHRAMGADALFSEGATSQKTWEGLIYILLAATLQDLNKEDVLNYQINELGRRDKNTCLLELFPLPSPSIQDWLYNQYSLLPYLSTRQSYTNYCAEFRSNHLKNSINKFCPKVVVFYGLTYKEYWYKIADVPFFEINQGVYNYQIGNNDKTLFAIIPHPTYRYTYKSGTHKYRITPEYFNELGKIIASKLNIDKIGNVRI